MIVTLVLVGMLCALLLAGGLCQLDEYLERRVRNWRGPLAMTPPLSVTCPRCGRTSYHPDDIADGYCGDCHDWTSPRPHRSGGDGILRSRDRGRW